uniref:Dual-specificity kinase n=1 Tax=Panagrolaimus sp. ES5 TaxID=591445 RepID=A0AC34GXH0_9BILA
MLNASNALGKGLGPDVALRRFGSKLTTFEKSEIMNYENVYFVGSAAKKHVVLSSIKKNNNGFDDEKGHYILNIHDHIGYRYEILKVMGSGSFANKGHYILNIHDHIGYRYEILKIMGSGSFANVVQAYDHAKKEFVALKIVKNKKNFHHQVKEEIRILEKLGHEDPDGSAKIGHIVDHFDFRNHKCIVFELMSYNLFDLLKMNGFKGFKELLVKKFAHSILESLEFVHRHNIIHADLKPENILLKTKYKSAVKVIDFGCSFFEDERIYTYIQSRFYRAPEVILGCDYGKPVDMWSFGCIVAELFTGHPLLPGEDASDQLALIIELLGLPPSKILKTSKRAMNFFSADGFPLYCSHKVFDDGFIAYGSGKSKRGKHRGAPKTRNWIATLKNEADDLFIDFLRRCLQWDPACRLTASDALQHPWIKRKLP